MNASAFYLIHNKIALGTGEQLLGKLKALPDEPRRQLLEVAVEGDWTTPSCPSCATQMVERQGGGKSFWGCTSFPRLPAHVSAEGRKSLIRRDRW